MKYCISLLLLALSVFSLAAQAASHTVAPRKASTVRKGELPASWRVAMLGTPLRRFSHLVPERRALPSQISYYSAPGESLTINGYQVTGISYGFYKDQLCCIELRVLGQANCQGLYSSVTRTLGAGQPLTSSSQKWATPQVSLLYTEMPKGYATVVLSSTPLIAQYYSDSQVISNTAA